MKKWLAIVVSVLLVMTMLPMGVVSVGASNNIVINGVDIGYAPGQYFTKNGGACYCHTNQNVNCLASQGDCNCMRYWPTGYAGTCQVDLLAVQCFGYARYCQWRVYGYHDRSASSYYTDLTGSISSAYCTGAVLKSKLLGCAPATHLRAKETVKGWGHSISIISTDDYGATITDCNYDYHCGIRVATYSWDQLASVVNSYGGVDYAKAWNRGYTPPASSVKLPDPICKPVREETFMLKNAAYPNLFMNVYAGKDANATKVVAWEIDLATQDQQFAMEYLGDGSYYLRAAGLTNRVLDIYWGSNNVVDYGDTLQVWTKGEYDQTTIFNVVPVGSNKYAIELKSLDNAVLTITGGSNDSAIGLYDYIANEAQHWYFCDLSGNIADPYAGDNHTWDNGVPTTPATCVSTGVMTFTCTICGLVDYHTIPVGDHTWDNGCDADCNVCGAERTVEDHTYDLTETTPATCINAGVMTYTCTSCGLAEQQTIPALGHAYDNDCDATCNVCGEKRDVTHDFVMIVQEATCTEYAKYCYTCQVCGYSYEKVMGDQVSDWSPDYPTNVDDERIESKKEYRYREWKETTEPLAEDGWVLDSTYTRLGDYGEWSGWSDVAITATDNVQVETRTVYPYYYYQCPNCGAHMHVYLGCYTWAGGCGQAGINSGNYVQIDSTIPYSSAGLSDFHGTGKYYTYIDGQLVFQHRDGSKTQYRSRARELETVYKYYRYTDWADWSEECNDTNAMAEERTVYRYVVAGLADHTYDNACDADCNVCGGVREVGDHVYDNVNDTTCNECGAVRQIAAQVLSGGLTSVSKDVDGLAFFFTANVSDSQTQNGYEYVEKSASVIPFVGGASYKVVKMGAVVSNQDGAILDMEHVDNSKIVDIEAKYLWEHSADAVSYAIRIIEIPDTSKDKIVTARPYYVYEVDGEEIVVYGDSISKSYNEVAQ